MLSELLLRGHYPYTPCSDRGIDCILENGVTINIKARHKIQHKITVRKKKKIYTYQREGYGFVKNTNRMYADFFIIWLIDDDDFYIIPVSKINGSFEIYPKTFKGHSGFSQFKNAWHLLQEG